MSEQWRPVLGYEGLYEISSLGRIKSLSRIVPRPQGRVSHRRERILNPDARTSAGGYIRVNLSNAEGPRSVTVHSLVAEAFHGRRPTGMVARHLDGNPANNLPSNLAWGTYGENERDKVAHGTHQKTRITHCPRGHLLQEPNLVASHRRRGHRSCLACKRAQDRARYRVDLDIQEMSDEIYSLFTIEDGVLA